MPNMRKILDDLRKRRSELHGLEKRSDEMLKQVIDKFYIVEGLNRLQTELDCLDLLVKNKANTDVSKTSDFGIETTELTASNSKLNMLKAFYHRSRKATMSAFSLLKVPLKHENSESEITTEQLRKITRLQRTKLSELMRVVKRTIVTNYGVLEQLQLLFEMHDKNMALWESLRQLAESIIPTENTADDIDEIVQKQEIYQQDIGESKVVVKSSSECVKEVIESKRELNSSKSATLGVESIQTCQTEILYECSNAITSDVEAAIGDGQSVMNPNAMTQTFVASKTNIPSEVLCNATEIDSPKNVCLMKKDFKTHATFSKAHKNELM